MPLSFSASVPGFSIFEWNGSRCHSTASASYRLNKLLGVFEKYLTSVLVCRKRFMKKLRRRVKLGSDGSFVLSWYNMWSSTVREEPKYHVLERQYCGKYFS
jgi:hypothetical protein